MAESEFEVARLAARQLEAYNRADLDAFCDCYADDVRVLQPDGVVRLAGREAFRAQYEQLFAHYRDVHADVVQRLAVGAHAVDHERWSRVDRETGARTEGEILVRYTVRDGRLALVEFLA